VIRPHRGDLWTVAGGGRVTSNARPALVVQSDLFKWSNYVTIALLTTDHVTSPARVLVAATAATGLKEPSYVMADKLHTISRTSLGARIGSISTATMLAVERAILVFLGIGG